MMLKLICFTHKASPEHTEIVKKWIGATGIDGVQLYNIPNHKPEDLIRDNTVVVTFGKFAELAVAYCFTEKQRKNARHIFLPHPRQLIPQIANKVSRTRCRYGLFALACLSWYHSEAFDLFRFGGGVLTFSSPDKRVANNHQAPFLSHACLCFSQPFLPIILPHLRHCIALSGWVIASSS